MPLPWKHLSVYEPKVCRGQWCKGAWQKWSVHSREEGLVSSLYKAWEPVPPRSVTSPLLPHWDFHTKSPHPPHLPSLRSEGPRGFSSLARVPSSSSPSWTEGSHASPGLSHSHTALKVATCALFFFPLTLSLGRGSRCQSPQRKVGASSAVLPFAITSKHVTPQSKVWQFCECCTVCFNYLVRFNKPFTNSLLVSVSRSLLFVHRPLLIFESDVAFLRKLHHFLMSLSACSQEFWKWLWQWCCVTDACLFLPSRGQEKICGLWTDTIVAVVGILDPCGWARWRETGW